MVSSALLGFSQQGSHMNADSKPVRDHITSFEGERFSCFSEVQQQMAAVCSCVYALRTSSNGAVDG
jgi:hypothetical protein